MFIAPRKRSEARGRGQEWNERKKDDFHFELIEHYFKNKDIPNAYQIINDQVIKDIDFYDLFEFVDRTSSKIGQQYLYNKLLVIDKNLNFEEQETIIDYFILNEDKRLRAQILFSKLNRRESFYISCLFLNDYISKPKWFWIIRLLSFTGLLLTVLTFFISKIIILLMICYIANMLIHFWKIRQRYFNCNLP